MIRPSLNRTGGAASAVLAALLLAAPSGAHAEIPWTHDVKQARADALRDHQPILLDFWATWCGPCNVMDTEVFSQERVATAMKKVRPVRIDIDRQVDVTRKYDVAGTPTLIVTDALGNELFRHGGLISADQLLGLLAELPADISRINALAASVSRDKGNFAALRDLGEELAAHAFFRASNEHYTRALKTKQGRERAEPRATILQALARNHTALQQPEEAAKILEQYRREFPRVP